MKKTEIKNVKPLLQQHIVSSSAEFEKAFNDFQMYKPIKVARELKDEFHNALSKHFIAMGIDRWEATIYPLKKSYKFQRT